MTDVSLPITSRTSSDDLDFADVYANDSAIAEVVNGGLTNENLSGSAGITAANLADSAVETAKIAPANVTAPKLESALLQAIGANDGTTTRRDYAEVLTEQSTSSTSFADLATVGPSVTVTVPTGGLVAVLAEVEGLQLDGLGWSVSLQGDADINALAIINASSTTFDHRWTSPSATDGVAPRGRAGFLTFPATAGTRTYKLQYRKTNGGGGFGATFKNRKLWVMVTGGF